MGMVALGFLLAPMLMLQGCADFTGDTSHVTTTNTTTDYGEGTVLLCNDSNCTAAKDDTHFSDGDAVVGVYDADYTQVECEAAGFFYCTIDNVCINDSLEDGSCR